MEYLIPITDVHAGDTIIPDGGFTCVPEGAPRIVHQDSWFRRTLPAFVLKWFGQTPANKWPTGDLYVNCAHGRHYLDGQLNDEGSHLIGFIKAATPVTEEETFGDEEYELVGYEAELTEDVGAYKAGDQFTIMGLEEEGGVFHLMDDEGRVVQANKTQVKVLGDWLT